MLVVDDNVDTVDSLAMLMKELGHDVRKAYDGTTALEAALLLRDTGVSWAMSISESTPMVASPSATRRSRQPPPMAIYTFRHALAFLPVCRRRKLGALLYVQTPAAIRFTPVSAARGLRSISPYIRGRSEFLASGQAF